MNHSKSQLIISILAPMICNKNVDQITSYLNIKNVNIKIMLLEYDSVIF